MGIKYDQNSGTWIASASSRHPITRLPKSLRRKNLKSEAEARRVERELAIQIDRSFHEELIPTWAAMIDRFTYTSLQRGLTTKTIQNYRLSLEAHTLQGWGDRRIDSITTQEIRELVTERLKHRSANQQKNVLKFIRAVFECAVESGLLDRNPCPKMKFRIGDKLKGVLTQTQVEKLLNTAKQLDSEWYPIWAMALYTGMRNGELYALTWDKVNVEKRQILVDCAWNNVDGFKSTKSGDERLVEIAPPLLPILMDLKVRSADSHFVLPRLDKWDKGEQARELRMFLIGLQLPPVRFHDLRATWATIMMSNNVAPIKVMAMGGWKDLKTMAIYMRKAGLDIKGITDNLALHNPSREIATVVQIGSRRDS